MGTPVNLISGSVTVGIDTTPDAATPANNSYTDAGFTMEGLEIDFGSEVVLHHVDQVEVPVKASLVKNGLVCKINLAEYTVVNLTNAIPGASSDGSTVKFGKPAGDSLVDMAIQFVGTGPNSTTRTVTIYNCNAIGQVDQKFEKGGVTMIPVELSAINDGTNPLIRIADA